MASLAIERMPQNSSGQARRAEMERTRAEARKLMGFALWRMLRDSSVQMDRAEIEQTRCEKRKLAGLAPERMPSDISGQARCGEVEQTLLDAWKSARKLHKPSLFDVLAVEILYAVFNLLASFSPRETIRQGAVCRRWRKIICGMHNLWNVLVLQPETSRKKVDIWLHRSGNALKSLSIRYGFAFCARPQVLHCFSNMIWERLEELHIQCRVNTRGLQEVLPDGALNRLRLQ